VFPLRDTKLEALKRSVKCTFRSLWRVKVLLCFDSQFCAKSRKT
jgi:hypothetical protein